MGATVTSLSQARCSLTMLAYEKLEELIVTLKLKPGSTHNENNLQQLIGIGRTPVREALQRLSREGLVEILPRKGIKITEVEYEGGFLRVELARTLLALMARTGAVRATSEQKQAFAEIATSFDRIAQTPELDLFMQFDKIMLNLLCEACHNEHICRAISLLVGEHRRIGYIHFQKHDDIAVFARIRAEFSRALNRADPEAAEAIVHQRMDYIESTLKGGTQTSTR
jgi:DNA-binding GntR family transcriptional regulator